MWTEGKWTLCQLVSSALSCSAGHHGASLNWVLSVKPSTTHHVTKIGMVLCVCLPLWEFLKLIAVLVLSLKHFRP